MVRRQPHELNIFRRREDWSLNAKVLWPWFGLEEHARVGKIFARIQYLEFILQYDTAATICECGPGHVCLGGAFHVAALITRR